MNLARRTVTIVLRDDAREALQRAAVGTPDPPVITAEVQETNDLGIWIRVRRTDQEHAVLVRWEYVLALDLVPVEPEGVGF